MTLKSMTGYGHGTARGGGMLVNVELSSVNRKTFEARVSLPEEMKPLQAELQRVLAEEVARGVVNCKVELEWSKQIKRGAVEIDEALARAYVDAIRGTARRLGVNEDLPASTLLELPGVVEFGVHDLDNSKMRELLLSAAQTALKRLDRMRRREGTALQKDIVRRFDNLERTAKNIRKRAPVAIENHRRELARRIAEAGGGIDVSDARFEREVVMYADKADIAEELTRLESHFKQVREIVGSDKPAGRALDFLAQELLREINTIASKSTDAEIAGLAIEFKSELERVREQVRNVE